VALPQAPSVALPQAPFVALSQAPSGSFVPGSLWGFAPLADSRPQTVLCPPIAIIIITRTISTIQLFKG